MESGSPVGSDRAGESPSVSRRFDSWKEIAAYFGRDVRTVRRWERNEALPVHRHLHKSRGSVYAFQHELDRWLASRNAPGPVASRTSLSPPGVVLLVTFSVFLALGAWAAVNDRVTFFAWQGRQATRGSSVVSAGPERSLDPSSRELFVLARHQLQRRTGYRREALEHLETVVGKAPDFAQAHALLGEAYLRQALFDPGRRDGAWPKAEAAARRALILDDRIATAHAVYGRILLLRDWNWSASAAEHLRAIELDPESPDVRSAYALYLRSAGRVTDAIVERERAQRADPLNPQWLAFLGDEYIFARRYEDAVKAYKQALERERDYRPAVTGLADVYARMDRHDDAAAWQLRSLKLRGQDELAAAFARVSEQEGAAAAIVWLDRWRLVEFSRAPDDHLWDMAYLHARVGNSAVALQLLERAYDRRDAGLLQARVDPDVDSLRGDPRFEDLLRRVGPN